MEKERVLFVCTHNSARSQMAEAFLKQAAGDRFEVESAGFEPAPVNPLVVEVMKEIGIDVSNNTSDSVFDFFKEGRLYQYVITVCKESDGGKCPLFPGITRRIHWTFDDPSGFEGSHEEKLRQTRTVRNAVRERLDDWLKELDH